MKKLGIFLMSVLALGFTACDEYEEVLPQSNPQQDLISTELGGVAINAGADLSAAAIDLNAFAGDSLEMVKTSKAPELNEGTFVTYIMEVAAENTFATSESISLADGKVAKKALDDAFRTLIGKTPKAKTLYLRFAPYLSDGASQVRIGKTNEYLVPAGAEGNAFAASVKPVDLGFVIDEAYYVVLDPMFGEGWKNTMIALDHSADKDQYDDPVFSKVCMLESGAQLLFIGSQGIEDAAADAPGNEYLYAWGVEDSGKTNGNLVYGEGGQVITVSKAGNYMVTLNMMDRTYKVEYMPPTMYIIGPYGWDWGVNDVAMTPAYDNTDTEGKYWSVIYLNDSGFKINSMQAWNGSEIGYAGAECVSHVDGVAFADNGGNIGVSKAGWYIVGVEKKLEGGAYKYIVNLFSPDIYVYGTCAGDAWGDTPEWMFTVPETADGEFVSPVLAADGELRLCVTPESDGAIWMGDWWKSEFIFFDGQIAYRGQGGDQERVQAKAGQKVYLNFKTGAARLE